MSHPRIAAVVLVAGMSTRMGRNKLLCGIGGKPLVRRVVEAVEKSAARPLVIVTGHDDERVRDALANAEAKFVRNPDFSDGLSTSLRLGIGSVGTCDGAIVVLGDMPAISAALIDMMISAFDPANDHAICVATFGGRRGNPVLFGRQFFPELQTITGDMGARNIVTKHPSLVCEIDAGDDAPLIDIDTPDDLKQFAKRL